MRQDVAYVSYQDAIDLEIRDGDLVPENGLETAVLISLFTDRYIEKENLPPSIVESRGNWADALEPDSFRLGSRLWAIDRIGKLDAPTRAGIEAAARESLEWFVEEGIAEEVNVRAVLVSGQRIDLDISIRRPEKNEDDVFKFLWDAQELKRS